MIIFGWKQLALYKIPLTRQRIFSPENLFLFIGYICGMLMVYSNPPFHSNDEDRHFYNSYFLSTGQVPPRQHEGQIGGYLPVNLFYISESFQGIPFNIGYKINRAKLKELECTPLQEQTKVFYDNPSYQINPVPYTPFVIGIWSAKIINSNPIHLLWGARIAGLIFYLLIVYMAIKFIPIHKCVMMALALNPMTLFQAASVTYDVMNISLSFLIVALALRYALREKQIRKAEMMIYVFISLIYCFAKPGYYIVPFLFFVIPQNNIGSPTKSLAMFVSLCVICCLPSLTWDNYVSSLQLKGGRVLQNDFYGNVHEQLQIITSAPGAFAIHFLLNFVTQGKEWIIGTMGRLGYSYTHLNHTILFIHGLVLFAISLLDSSKNMLLSLRQKMIIGSIGYGNIVIIAVGFFLLSPVGSITIYGLQGRYFISLLPLIFLLNFNRAFWNKFWEKWKNAIIASYSCLLLGYTVYFINTHFY
ncbi:MAG TPA: DUF2142 domain-containing protein [Chitinivibrionales bacterium]|nr:DUF2142 domain-containing protein [Chitinivibrionales bacterium]